MDELTSIEDAALINRAKRGDHAAYHELVNRYKQAGYRIACQVMRNPSDAEDALQEALIKAYVYLHSYSDRYRFYTWFSTIVRNVAYSHLRARDWLVGPLDDELLLPLRSALEESPELAALASSRQDMVRQAVNQLPERYRRVLVLRYWHELSYDEIAAVTEQSLAAVKTQIFRAKALLAASLRGAEFGLAPE